MAKINVKDSDFLYGAAGGAPATVFGQVSDGSIDLGELSLVDVTTKDNGTKAMTAGVRDSMSGTVTVVWDPAETSHAAIMTKYLAKTLESIGFVLKDNATPTPAAIETYYADGYFTNVSAPIASGGGDARMECTFSFKCTGAFTRA